MVIGHIRSFQPNIIQTIAKNQENAGAGFTRKVFEGFKELNKGVR
jgi:hypothetical protein